MLTTVRLVKNKIPQCKAPTHLAFQPLETNLVQLMQLAAREFPLEPHHIDEMVSLKPGVSRLAAVTE